MRVCMGVVCRCVVLVCVDADDVCVLYIGLILLCKHVCLLGCVHILARNITVHMHKYVYFHIFIDNLSVSFYTYMHPRIHAFVMFEMGRYRDMTMHILVRSIVFYCLY